MVSTKRTALGKGLGALLGAPKVSVHEIPPSPASPAVARVMLPTEASILFVDRAAIKLNPDQPRQRFSQESLEELAESIKNHGVLQPILLTRLKGEAEYTLVAGERRYRAAGIAGLERIPAIVQSMTREEMLEIAIVENVQRDDLNPVEEARAYRKLMDTFGWSQEQVAQRVGKGRPTVANALRLLKLGNDILLELEEGRMTAGHARAILSVDDNFYRLKLRKEIVAKGISVREAEKRATSYQKAGKPIQGAKTSAKNRPEELDIVALQDRLMEHLGCRVKIHSRDGQSGTVEIPFGTPDELSRFLQSIGLPDT